MDPDDKQSRETHGRGRASCSRRADDFGHFCSGSCPAVAGGLQIGRFPGGATGWCYCFILVGAGNLVLGVFRNEAWAAVYFNPPSAMLCRFRSRPGHLPLFSHPGQMAKFGPIHPTKLKRRPARMCLPRSDQCSDSKRHRNCRLAVRRNREIYILMHAKYVGNSFYVRELRGSRICPGIRSSIISRRRKRQVRNRLYSALPAWDTKHEKRTRGAVPGRLR